MFQSEARDSFCLFPMGGAGDGVMRPIPQAHPERRRYCVLTPSVTMIDKTTRLMVKPTDRP